MPLVLPNFAEIYQSLQPQNVRSYKMLAERPENRNLYGKMVGPNILPHGLKLAADSNVRQSRWTRTFQGVSCRIKSARHAPKEAHFAPDRSSCWPRISAHSARAYSRSTRAASPRHR